MGSWIQSKTNWPKHWDRRVPIDLSGLKQSFCVEQVWLTCLIFSYHRVDTMSVVFFFFDRWMEGEQGLLFALLKKKKWRGKKLRMPCDLFNSSMTFPPPSMFNHNNNNYYFYGPPQVERPHITESHSNVHTLPISKLRIASPPLRFRLHTLNLSNE